MTAESIDVWSADLDALAAHRGPELGEFLSKDERERASLLRDPNASQRYSAGRELLRIILAQRCALDPADVVFEYGPYGKPSMRSGGHGNAFFSVAHCDRLCVIGITQLSEIGIDIERIREEVDIERIASRLFPHEEVSKATVPDGAVGAFFEAWVRKESLVKAIGTGLLPSWGVRSEERGRAAQSDARARAAEKAGWTFSLFSPAPDVVGCLALRGAHHVRVRLRSLAELCGPSGIRTRDLHLERVASLAARRWGLVAGVPGFEPGLAEPESAGLPGYPTPQGTAEL